MALVLFALFASFADAQEVAITPTEGPWFIAFGFEFCSSRQTYDEAAMDVMAYVNARPHSGPDAESVLCTDYATHSSSLFNDPIDTVPGCAPESNLVETGHSNDNSPSCGLVLVGGGTTGGILHPERHVECPAGYFLDSEPIPNHRLICRVTIDDLCHIGDPVSPAYGNLVQEELDYSSGGANPLQFRRYYNGSRYFAPGFVAVGERTGGFTNVWGHTYGGRVYAETLNEGVATTAVRPDGAMWHFDATGKEIHNRSGTGAAARIQHLADGSWRLTLANADVETYTSSGRLASITTRAGFVTTISYSGNQIQVSDGFGRTLTLALDASGRIDSLTNPGGGIIAYGYSGTQSDGSEALESVTYPDSTVRQYTYATTGGRSRLATIVDENNQTYASFSYYSDGSVSSSEHAGGADRHSFVYTAQPSGQRRLITVTDPLGQVRNYQTTRVGGVQRISTVTGGPCDSCGLIAASSYDANGNRSQATDFDGNRTSYVFDLSRNLETSRTEASNTPERRTITTTWHSTYRLPLTITEPNRTTEYTYDAVGNMLTKSIADTSTMPTTRTWTYTYDAIGHVLSEDGPRSDVSDTTVYTYYNCNTGQGCGQIETITNALGQVTTFNSYNAHGQPLTITDANSIVTLLTYDNRQRLTSLQVANELTTYSYWPTGLLRRVTLPDGSYLEYGYDAAHRLTQIADGDGNRIVYSLDPMGNRTAESTYDPSNVLSRTRTRVFNSLNQLWKEIGAAGTPAVTTTYSYDGNGNQIGINAPLGRNTSNQIDGLNRLIQITDPGMGVTQNGYDANDNVISVTDPRNLVTSYGYNGFGEQISQTSPDTGTTTSSYDAAGNLKTRTDSRGITGVYNYDALNRLTSIVFPDQTVNFSYDLGANGVGRLTGASDAAHNMAWSYDAQGRTSTKTQTVGGLTRSVGYAYASGNLSSLTTPSGQTITYGYSQGRLTSIAVNGTPLLNAVLYEPFGPVRQWTWSNGTLAVRTYDADMRIAQIDSSGDLSNYRYDDANRITGLENTSSAALSWDLGYNTRDNLVSGALADRTLFWTYDANGNRTLHNELGSAGLSETYAVSTTSNLLMSMSGSRSNIYGYDNAGNIVSETNSRRPVSLPSATTTSYIYNALSQRVAKNVGSVVTYFVYDEAGHLLGEYGGSGALIQETVWMGDIPVATLRPRAGGGVDIFYVHTDHLNTPRKVTRPADNALLWRWDIAPFGDSLPNENPEGAGTFRYNLRFPGQYYDSESGLHYNYARDYDPQTGRYIESDPTGLDGGLNTFAYGRGNPIMAIDPQGLLALSIETSWEDVKAIPQTDGPGYTIPAMPDAKCACKPGCSGWKLTECSAVLKLRILILAGLPPGIDRPAREAEQQHVTDFEIGADVIAEHGVRAEQAMRQKSFSNQADCERQASVAVTKALRHGRDLIRNMSFHIWDESGAHYIWHPSPYLPQPRMQR